MKKTSVDVQIDFRSTPMMATVSGHIVEKYARQLLQQKLKKESWLDNWMCWSRERDDNGDYLFEVSNGHIQFMKTAIAIFEGNPKIVGIKR